MNMGTVVDLASRRRERLASPTSNGHQRAQCFIDLSCPFSYLAAERVARGLTAVSWQLASTTGLHRGDAAAGHGDVERLQAAAERRAAELRVPLVWPDRFPAEAPAAMRVASLAIEQGHGEQFVLAAGRLAFCGGFDLEDPEILAEAAAAAQVDLDDCLRAARDASRDEAIEVTSRRLLAAGVDRLPALKVGRSLIHGERRLSAYLLARPAAGRAASR